MAAARGATRARAAGRAAPRTRSAAQDVPRASTAGRSGSHARVLSGVVADAEGVTPAAAPDQVLFINGPNANLYGHTDQDIYGAETFTELGLRCQRAAAGIGIALDFRQSNSEGGVIDAIQQAIGTARGVIINGAGLTYTSIAVLDALQAFPGPIVEVHMSNIYRREPFRHFSFVSRAATGIVAGLGADGYELAVHAMRRLLDRSAGPRHAVLAAPAPDVALASTRALAVAAATPARRAATRGGADTNESDAVRPLPRSGARANPRRGGG